MTNVNTIIQTKSNSEIKELYDSLIQNNPVEAHSLRSNFLLKVLDSAGKIEWTPVLEYMVEEEYKLIASRDMLRISALYPNGMEVESETPISRLNSFLKASLMTSHEEKKDFSSLEMSMIKEFSFLQRGSIKRMLLNFLTYTFYGEEKYINALTLRCLFDLKDICEPLGEIFEDNLETLDITIYDEKLMNLYNEHINNPNILEEEFDYIRFGMQFMLTYYLSVGNNISAEYYSMKLMQILKPNHFLINVLRLINKERFQETPAI